MRVVAVFGGGGAKSLACVGAWRAMVEAGMTPVQLVGTSMGAVVAAAFASGATYDEVVIAGRTLSRRDVAPFDPLAFVKGLFATHVLKPDGPRRVIERLVPATRFDELRIPLTITSTDLDSGELVLFGAGGRSDVPLRDALYASCALPLYFPPAVIDGRSLGDGGLRAVLGLEAAARIPADLVVAIHVGPGFDEPPLRSLTAPSRLLPPPLVRTHGAAIRVMMAAQVEQLIADWPKDAARLVVVRPVAEREATFAVDAGERYLRAGYEATKRALADTLNC
ncbi:MAG TPA: patatin-like phospholipase family protein [Gemmatimonadales bacterium]|nr:patatin-like phospholipase family protein [Gemmatimonadales bacterium]